MTELTYAKAGGPPLDWAKLIVRDLDTGAEMRRVIEVDTAACWVRHHAEGGDGRIAIDRVKGEAIVIQRSGRFAIEVKA